MEKTNNDLAVYAQNAYSEQWGYVWGTFGNLLTEALLKQKIAQYPEGVGEYEDFIRTHWMGRKVTDCVGLIKSCMWWDGTVVRYDPSTDVTADTMMAKASVKGDIQTISDTPGLCVWKKGHIGVSLGNGNVIEAKATEIGVIMSPLNGPGANTWTNWLQCPFITYDTNR